MAEGTNQEVQAGHRPADDNCQERGNQQDWFEVGAHGARPAERQARGEDEHRGRADQPTAVEERRHSP